MTAVNDWREQEVVNETRSREINEWIDEANESSGELADPFVCECSDGDCTSTITLTHLEYEEVRGDGTHFAIATHHESPDLDVLLSERVGFAIVRKLPGCRRGSPRRRILGDRSEHMLKTRTSDRVDGRPVAVAPAGSVGRRQRSLAPYQTRTCARCGRHTTFVLDDPAGGWYVCIECGRYA